MKRMKKIEKKTNAKKEVKTDKKGSKTVKKDDKKPEKEASIHIDFDYIFHYLSKDRAYFVYFYFVLFIYNLL